MGIYVRRGAVVRMAKQVLKHLDRDLLTDGHGRHGVTDVMEADVGETGIDEEASVRLIEPGGRDRASAPRGQDDITGELATGAERREHVGGDRQIAEPGVGLRFILDESSGAEALTLVTDVDHLTMEVDVLPAQAAELAAAQAAAERQQPGEAVGTASDGSHISRDVRVIEPLGTALSVLRAQYFHHGRDRELTLGLSIREGFVQDAIDELCRARVASVADLRQ